MVVPDHAAQDVRTVKLPQGGNQGLVLEADSMGCRNISTMEVLYGKTKGVDARENRSVSDAFARAT